MNSSAPVLVKFSNCPNIRLLPLPYTNSPPFLVANVSKKALNLLNDSFASAPVCKKFIMYNNLKFIMNYVKVITLFDWTAA